MDQRNNLRSDLVKLYICLKQIIINYGTNGYHFLLPKVTLNYFIISDVK